MRVMETGCWRRCWRWVPGAGGVSWLCTRWRQVAGAGAGAGRRCWCARGGGCWYRVPGAGAGAASWLCTWWRQVAGAGAGVSWLGGDRLLVLVVLVLGAGAGAGAVSWLVRGARWAPVLALVL